MNESTKSTISSSPMAPKDYLSRELLAGGIVNAILGSLGFLAVFGASGPIEVWGPGNYVFDFLPSSFAIGLLACLIPSLMTRRALRLGKVAPLNEESWRLPGNLFLRAFIVGVLASALISTIAFLLFTLTGLQSIDWSVAFLIRLAITVVLGYFAMRIGMRGVLMRAEKRNG